MLEPLKIISGHFDLSTTIFPGALGVGVGVGAGAGVGVGDGAGVGAAHPNKPVIRAANTTLITITCTIVFIEKPPFLVFRFTI